MFIKITQFIISLLAFVIFGLATFAYAQSAPQVATEDVTNRNIYEARLQGTASFTNAIPFGQVYFEYGRNSVYSSETSKKSVTESGSFDEKITGLNEDTGYHYRAVLVASDGQVYFGEDKSFITKRVSDPNPPVIPGQDESGDNAVADPGDLTCPNDAAPIPVYQITQGTQAPIVRGDLGSEVVVTATRGGIIGYRCPGPEDEEYFGATATPPGGTGVDVGEPEERTGGGSLISPSNPTIEVNGGSTFVDESPDGIVPKCGEPGEPICDFKFLIELIQNIISWIISISVIIMVAVITYAGILYMISGGSPDKIKKAKGMFVKAGIGMFWVLAGWLVINSALNLVLNDDDAEKIQKETKGDDGGSLRFLDQSKN